MSRVVSPAPVLVLTGPSGVGKGTLCRMLLDRLPQLEITVSATTRPPRPGEQDGRDYHFLTEEQFDRQLAAGGFVEWAQYAGRRYGTLRSELDRRTGAGRPVLLEIEVQGAAQLRASTPGAVLIFIAPPSMQSLQERLSGRGTESDAQLQARIARAEQECAHADRFDHVVVNDDLATAFAQLETVVLTALSPARAAA